MASPPRPTPPCLPAPCLHTTHPVFNPVLPTTHSSNASATRGDTYIEKHDPGIISRNILHVDTILAATSIARSGVQSEYLSLELRLPVMGDEATEQRPLGGLSGWLAASGASGCRGSLESPRRGAMKKLRLERWFIKA